MFLTWSRDFSKFYHVLKIFFLGKKIETVRKSQKKIVFWLQEFEKQKAEAQKHKSHAFYSASTGLFIYYHYLVKWWLSQRIAYQPTNAYITSYF